MEKEVAGVWRTVRGRRIFIREGEDLKTAMINSGKFKELGAKVSAKDDELWNKKFKMQDELDSIKHELAKKHYTGGDLDEDVDSLRSKREQLMKERTEIQAQREINEERYLRAKQDNDEGLSITNEQFENLKRNGNVNNLAEKTMKENAEKAMTYMGKTPEQIKEVIDEWKAKKNADKFDKARYEEHKQFVDSQIEAWEKTYKEATSDSNYKARLKEMNDRDIVYKEKSKDFEKPKYTSVMDRYNKDKEFRDRLKAEADKEALRTQQYADEYLSRYNVSEINDDGYEAFTNFAEETGMSYDSAKRYLQDRAKNSYKGLSDKQIVEKKQKLESELPADYKEASLRGYKYYTKHGMGPGAVPTDVKISNVKDYDDGMTSFETNRPLSSKELNFYSIENEIKNAGYDAKYGHNSTSDSKIKNYTNSSVQDLRKAMRNMKPYEEEIQIGGRVITKTSNGYGVRSQYDYDDPMTDYSAYVYGFKEKWIIDEAVKKGELKQTEVKAKVERFRERKGTSSSSNNGSVESLSKQALIEKLVDDQIARGVVKAENRALQIKTRKNMTKSELLKYFK